MKKSLYVKLKEKEYIPTVAFAVIITVFCVAFLKLFIKMDDGNFLGIVYAPDFSYIKWLAERYNTVSGRTAGEFLLAFFLKHNIIYWKLANAAVIIYIVCFWCRVSGCFGGGFSLTERRIFCCCGIFLMIVSCLNPSAFWFAGSFSYLWPFAGILLTVSPLVFYLLEDKLNSAGIAVSCFAALIGTMQEQAAACCTAIYVILIIFILIKKQKFKINLFIPLIPISICDYWLFSAPGASGRISMEAQSSFERYLNFNIFQKLACGLSVFFANSFYLSFFLMILFVFLITFKLSENTDSKKMKAFFCFVNAVTVGICIVVNIFISVLEKALPHMIFRNAFVSGKLSISFYVLFASGCLLTLILICLILRLILIERVIGLAVGLCTSAGFFSALAMSFSPTVFSSGQRVAFYTNMFIITACVFLLSSVQKNKVSNAFYNLSIVYACGSFAVDCIAFKIVEIPIMG